jgi:hypothetical protein
MKTIEITLYKFEELSKEAQQKAIENNYDFNVSHDWWNCTYDDALNIGLEINGFDLDRGNSIQTKLNKPLSQCVDIIISEYGEDCKAYKTAKYFRDSWDRLVAEHSDGVKVDRVAEGKEDDFDDEAEDLERLFKNNISNNYLEMLKTEHEYLTSEECIKDSLIANDYDFTEAGKIY